MNPRKILVAVVVLVALASCTHTPPPSPGPDEHARFETELAEIRMKLNSTRTVQTEIPSLEQNVVQKCGRAKVDEMVRLNASAPPLDDPRTYAPYVRYLNRVPKKDRREMLVRDYFRMASEVNRLIFDIRYYTLLRMTLRSCAS